MPKSKGNRKSKGRNRQAAGASGRPRAGPSARAAAHIEAAQLLDAGSTLLDAGDYAGAIVAYESALNADQRVARSRRNRRRVASAYAGRGNTRTHAGDYAGAQQDYAIAAELALDLPENPHTLEMDRLLDQGFFKDEQGDYAGAMACYSLAVANNPNAATAYLIRGEAKSEQGDYAGAIADYDQSIICCPYFAVLYDSRSDARTSLGDYDGAIADYDCALILWPDNPRFYNGRGRVKAQQGDYAGAIADYDQAIICCRPDDADTFHNRHRARLGLAVPTAGALSAAAEPPADAAASADAATAPPERLG